MKCSRWFAAALGVGVWVAVSDVSAAEATSGGQCISENARQELSTCPEGVKQFTPMSGQPKSVHLGTVAPQEQGKKDSKLGDPTVDLESQKTLRGIKIAAKVRNLLNTEISQLEQLFKVTNRNAPDRVTLARRLAETYGELENAAFRDKTQAQIQNNQNAVAQSQKVEVSARANAIRYYKLISTEYKNYPQLDEVLYYLAYEYEQSKNLDEARKVYFQLINDTPQSKYIPNAYLAFGELFFGEAQSDPSKYQLARDAYLKVLEYPPNTNKVWGYAEYKLGYAYSNMGDNPKALDAFRKVIEYGNQYASQPGVGGLQQAARKDIIPVYTLVGKPDQSYAFFKPLSGDVGGDNKKTFEMMDNLGLNYIDTGHYVEAITLYEDLLKRDKGDNSCKYQSHIVQATMAMKGGANKANVMAKLDDQMQMYRTFKAANHSEESKKACANLTAELVTETAMSWHLEAVGSKGVRGTGEKKTMGFAAHLYGLVVDNFNKQEFAAFEFPRIVKEDWPSLFKIKYAQADLLYFEENWKECGPAFDRVVEEDPNGTEAAEAAFAAVLCYQKQYDQEHVGNIARRGSGNLPGQDAKQGGVDAFKKKEMSPSKKGMVKAFDRYVCYIKPAEGDTKAKDQYVEVKYARARTYFEEHYWEEAAVGFRDIALNYADTDAGIYASQLYLEALNVLGKSGDPPRPSCYDEMGEAVPQIVKLYCEGGKASKNQEQCTLLAKIQCDIQRQKAQSVSELAKKGGPELLKLHEKSAALYIDLWKQYGEGPLSNNQPAQCDRMDEIVFNAAEEYQQARLIAKSIQARLILLDPRYKMDKSDLARRSTYKIGGNYQAIAVYDQAAEWYERYAKMFPDAEKAYTALSDAVVLRLGLGQEDEALKDTKFFLDKYGASRPTETAQVAFAIGAHYVEREDWENARKRLSGAMNLIDKNATLDVKVQAHALLGRVSIRIKNDRGATGEYKKVQDFWKDPKSAADKIMSANADDGARRLGKALTAVGEAYFYFAERERKKVDAIKFPDYHGHADRVSVSKFIQNQVKGWIAKKVPAIDSAEREYKKIVDLQPEPPPKWVIAAGARVGGMRGEFVREFRAAPIPTDIKRDDELRNAYYGGLDEASEPEKRRAKGAFETCLNYSVKFQYFDQYSRSCEEWLSKTYKNEYHQVDEFRSSPNRVNSGLSDRPYPLQLDKTPYNPNPPPPPEPEKADTNNANGTSGKDKAKDTNGGKGKEKDNKKPRRAPKGIR